MVHVSVEERTEQDAKQPSYRTGNDAELLERQMEDALDGFDQKQNRDEQSTDKDGLRESGFSGHIRPAFVRWSGNFSKQILRTTKAAGIKDLSFDREYHG